MDIDWAYLFVLYVLARLAFSAILGYLMASLLLKSGSSALEAIACMLFTTFFGPQFVMLAVSLTTINFLEERFPVR